MSKAYVKKLNRVVMDPEDMGAVLSAAAELPKERRSFETLVCLMCDVMPDKDVEYRVALGFRLRALNTLSITDLIGFARPLAEPGAELIHHSVVVAACTCPLVAVDKYTVSFDKAKFRATAMTAMEPEGSA